MMPVMRRMRPRPPDDVVSLVSSFFFTSPMASFTVSVAALLSTEPAAFLITQRYFQPFCSAVTFSTV